MILYLSAGTSYSIYDELFNKGYIKGGYQQQKFNDNIVRGLSNFDKVVALSALPCSNCRVDEIKKEENGVIYHSIKSVKGKLNKIVKITELIKVGKKIIKKYKIDCIICDAISSAPSMASVKLGKKYNLPTYAIVTDVPEKMVGGEMGFTGKITAKLMKKYDGYILLTEQMNEIVNPNNKPFIVMEGACANAPKLTEKGSVKNIMYTGSLWKNDAGIEYFTEGFIEANLDGVELHYYGTGEAVSYLQEVSKTYPSVKYMGCVTNEQIVKEQTKATLLVNPRPSNEEFCKYSFPSKTFEYMVSGTPVLMTKLPGVQKEYFDYVFTIDNETSDGVKEKLQEIFSLSFDELIEKGLTARKFVMENKNYIAQSEKIFKFIKSN